MSHSRCCFIHAFIHWLTHSFVYLFAHACIHSFLRSLLNLGVCSIVDSLDFNIVGASYKHLTNRLEWQSRYGYLAASIPSSSSPWDCAGWLAIPPLPMGTNSMLKVMMMVPVEEGFICSSGPQQLQPAVHITLSHTVLHNVGSQTTHLWWFVHWMAELQQQSAFCTDASLRCRYCCRVPHKTWLLMSWSVHGHQHATGKAVMHASQQAIHVDRKGYQQVLSTSWTAANICCSRSQAKACAGAGKPEV